LQRHRFKSTPDVEVQKFHSLKPNVMNTLRNKVSLIGNVGMDPVINTFGEGKKVCRISLATNETYTSRSGERVTNTQWHTLVAWGPVATIASRLLKKGKEVAVQGKLVNRSYQDSNGITRSVTEIVVDELMLVSR